MDSVLDMGTNKSSEVNAPKTVERLEKISAEQNQKEKRKKKNMMMMMTKIVSKFLMMPNLI